MDKNTSFVRKIIDMRRSHDNVNAMFEFVLVKMNNSDILNVHIAWVRDYCDSVFSC